MQFSTFILTTVETINLTRPIVNSGMQFQCRIKNLYFGQHHVNVTELITFIGNHSMMKVRPDLMCVYV